MPCEVKHPDAVGGPIVFEGVSLPHVAIFLDQLSRGDTAPELSPETSEWFWRLPICRGVQKKAKSTNVIRHTTEVSQSLKTRESEILACVAVRLGGEIHGLEDLIDEWMRSLQMMRMIATSRNECRWIWD